MPVATHRIRTIADKRRWTRRDAEVMVRAWRESRTSGLDFCDRFQINQVRLEKWATQIGDAPRMGNGERHLAIYPAKVVTQPPPRQTHNSSDNRIEVVLPSGVTLRLGEHFEAQTLSRVLQVLQC